MRKTAKLGLSVLSAVTLLTAPATTSYAESSHTGHGSGHGQDQGHGGASHTGQYPNVFAQAGYSKHAIDAKVNAAWQQLFHGDPGTDSTHHDGQTLYYQLTPDMAYVEDVANQDVRTEGIGYAMMISVQTGHKHEFDSLWNFAKTKMQIQSGPTKDFFAWHTDTTGKIIDTGVAPDGDQWIAAALAFASGRWGDGHGIYAYRTEATRILHAMWHQSDTGGVDMFDRQSHLPTFSPPYAVNYTDPSYSLPAFYKIFAKVDPSDKDLWNAADAAGEQILQKAANPQTGLVPDYANFDGTPYMTAANTPTDDAYNHNFQEDAWRAIANANVDAAWFGKEPWQTKYSNTLEKFFAGKGVTTYVSRWHLDGTPITTGQNTYEPAHAQGLVAMNSTTAITTTEKTKTAFVRDFWNTEIPSGYARYYDGMLYMLGLLYDSGEFRIWSSPNGHGHSHGRG